MSTKHIKHLKQEHDNNRVTIDMPYDLSALDFNRRIHHTEFDIIWFLLYNAKAEFMDRFKGRFNRWEEDKRTSNYKIAKKHFKFFYNSFIEKRESYILLDIVQSNYSFLGTIEKSINLPLFEIDK